MNQSIWASVRARPVALGADDVEHRRPRTAPLTGRRRSGRRGRRRPGAPRPAVDTRRRLEQHAGHRTRTATGGSGRRAERARRRRRPLTRATSRRPRGVSRSAAPGRTQRRSRCRCEAFSTLHPLDDAAVVDHGGRPHPESASTGRRRSVMALRRREPVPVDPVRIRSVVRHRGSSLDVGLAVGGRGAGPAHETGDHKRVTHVGRHQHELDWDRRAEDRRAGSAGDSAKPNRRAANRAPSGVQRPKIMAARAMKPRPAVMSSLEAPTDAEREVGARQTRPWPRRGARSVPDAVHVDADGVGGLAGARPRRGPEDPTGSGRGQPVTAATRMYIRYTKTSVAEQHRADHRDVAEHRDRRSAKGAGVFRSRVSGEAAGDVQEAR